MLKLQQFLIHKAGIMSHSMHGSAHWYKLATGKSTRRPVSIAPDAVLASDTQQLEAHGNPFKSVQVDSQDTPAWAPASGDRIDAIPPSLRIKHGSNLTSSQGLRDYSDPILGLFSRVSLGLW